MSTGMLPKFHVRNLRSSNQPVEKTDSLGSLVKISAPAYDMTISNNPAATLKYRDEDGDKITLGSSQELIEKLEEPITQPSANSSRRKKDRLSIAMLLSEVQQNPDAVNHHTFDIEEREEIQKLWQEIQQRNRTPPPFSASALAEPSSGDLQDNTAHFRDPLNQAPSLEEVAEEVDGGSPDSTGPCKGTVVESMEENPQDQKNMLAAAYEKSKAKFWTTIAADIGTSWEEAEALHWALGKDEMIRRAERVVNFQCDSSEGLVSVNSTNGDWHENRKNSIQPRVNVCTAQKFEDYRKHHFNATMPPQLRHAVPASQAGTKSTHVKAPYAGIAKSAPSKGTFPTLVATPSANLTMEGKRQAQAAGDILRSRTTPSRHRKAINTATDHTKHQNRWASYKSPGTTFSSEPSTISSQNCSVSTLTPEGRRQAQAAGDKLRSRTNPIRHSRPRSGSFEHGVNKNRWASYVGSRGVRDDEHPVCLRELKQEVKPKKSETAEEVKQPSLLEVFEAELAKSFLEPDAVQDEGQAPEPEVIDIPSTEHESGSPLPHSHSTSTPIRVASQPQTPSAPLSGVDLVNNCVQRLTSAGGAQEFSQAIDQSVRAATGAIEALVLGVPGRLQQALSQCEQSGILQQEVEINGIDNAFNSLRELVNNIGANSNGPQTTERGSTTNIETATNASDGTDTHPSSNNTIETQGHVADTVTPSPGEVHDYAPHAECKASNNIGQAPSSPSENHVTPQVKLTDSPHSRRERKADGLRFHKPGPIHLPHVTQPRPDVETSFVGFEGNPWQQFDTLENVDDPTISPSAIRFPTLAQFEGQDFNPDLSFPALPSMEPLVPQQVRNQSSTEKPDIRAAENLDAVDTSSKTQQSSNSTNPATRRCGPTGNSMGRPSHARFSDHVFQSPAVQQQPITASHSERLNELQQQFQDLEARSRSNEQQSRGGLSKIKQEQTSGDSGQCNFLANSNLSSQALSGPALADYQMQLMLLEQQNKKRLLMARTEQKRLQRDSEPVNCYTPDFASRLAEPFNPLDAEPSAQPHLTRGIPRNATIGGLAPEYHARSRRPYSDAFHGYGRGTQGSFKGDTANEEDEVAKLQGKAPSSGLDQGPNRATQGHDEHQKRQGQLKRSATTHEWRPTPTLSRSDAAKADKINACVRQLRDLGFGNGKPDSGDRLLVYAQASDGDLVEAIDMIDEEQRAQRAYRNL